MPILKSHFHFHRDSSFDLSFDPPNVLGGKFNRIGTTIGTQFRKQKYFLISTLGFALQWIDSTYHGRKRNSIELRQKLVKKFELNSGDGNLPASSDFLTFLLASQWTKYVKPLFEYLQRNTIFWYSNISKNSIFNPLHLPHIGHNNLLGNFDCPGAQWPDISQHFWSNSQFLQLSIFFDVLFHLFHFLWLRKALTFIRLQNLSFPQIFHRLQSIETEKNNMEVAKLILRMWASVKVFYYWKWYEFSKILNVTYKKYQIWLLSNKSPASMCDKVYYMSVCGWACLPSRSLLRVTHKSKNPLSVPQPTTNYNPTRETFQGLNGLSSTK